LKLSESQGAGTERNRLPVHAARVVDFLNLLRLSSAKFEGTKVTLLILARSGELLMLRSRPPRPIRTTLDLADAEQVKSVRKRLRITHADLVRIVERIGNSLSAIGKEVELQNQLATQPCKLKNRPATFK
jgi:hypothetical protein